MTAIRWRKKLAVLSTGVAFQLLTVSPITGGACDLLRFPTIGVWDWIDRVPHATQPTRPPISSDPSCHDGIDNDGDGVRDADDPDCWDIIQL